MPSTISRLPIGFTSTGGHFGVLVNPGSSHQSGPAVIISSLDVCTGLQEHADYVWTCIFLSGSHQSGPADLVPSVDIRAGLQENRDNRWVLVIPRGYH